MTDRVNARFHLGQVLVNRLGYGAMRLTGPGVFGPPSDRAAAVALLRAAIELGVDHTDTAQYYGPDVVNDLIREALFRYPDKLAIVTSRMDSASQYRRLASVFTIDSKGRAGSASVLLMRLGDVITMFLTPAGTGLTRAPILADDASMTTTPGQHRRASRGTAWRVNPAGGP